MTVKARPNGLCQEVLPQMISKGKAKKSPRRAKASLIKSDTEFLICPDEPVFPSGVVCKLLAVPIWVLKQLDREGIVSPPRKNEGQSRLYSKRELNKLNYVWYLMDKRGVKVDGIRVILEMEQEVYVCRT